MSSSMTRLTSSSANSGLPPERSASCGTAPSPSPRPLISAATSSCACSSLSGSSAIVTEFRHVRAPAGPRLQQLLARQPDDQERSPHRAREVVDQVEHSLVRPVDVVEGEHQRAAPRRSPRPPRARLRRAPRASAAGPRSPAGAAPPRARCRASRRAARRCGGRTPARRSPPSAPPPRRGASARRRSARRCREARTPPAGPPRAAGRPPRRTASTGPGGSSGSDRWRAMLDSSSRSNRDLPTPACPRIVTR